MGPADRSSSNDLSSVPESDAENSFTAPPSHSNTIVVASSVLSNPNPTNGKPSRAQTTASATRQDPPVKQPRQRKKKEADLNAPPAAEKEKKPRKARTPAAAGRVNKKLKVEGDSLTPTISQHTTSATDLNNSRLVQPTAFTSDPSGVHLHEAAKTTQNGFSKQNQATMPQPQLQSPNTYHYQSTPQPQPQPQPQPAPQHSRSRFDPVRDIERPSEQPQPTTYQTPTVTPPRPPFRPSASPAISSIINPPDIVESKPVSYHVTPKQLDRVVDEPTITGETTYSGSILAVRDVVDTPSTKPPAAEKPVPVPEAEPKLKKAKEPIQPAPSGSGLLNSAFFGGDSSNDKAEDAGKGTTIYLQIDLSREENKIFNFSRLAEDKYGFAAVYPRQAAQKERLAKVAAAGAVLERLGSNGKRGELSIADSGDEDLSVDIDRDSDNDGDVNMTGLNGTNENSGTDGPVPRPRRKRKDEYDAEDPFVDDSEALWEAQAAASKDGFFVYMGALVTEEKPVSERSDGPAKRGGRGRGRGGGPGSRGGRGAASAASSGVGRGGSSSRGGGASRKPRTTKAEKHQKELEKEQKEQVGSVVTGKPTTAPV